MTPSARVPRRARATSTNIDEGMSLQFAESARAPIAQVTIQYQDAKSYNPRAPDVGWSEVPVATFYGVDPAIPQDTRSPAWSFNPQTATSVPPDDTFIV